MSGFLPLWFAPVLTFVLPLLGGYMLVATDFDKGTVAARHRAIGVGLAALFASTLLTLEVLQLGMASFNNGRLLSGQTLATRSQFLHVMFSHGAR